jgi:hypothetical protein
VSSRSRFAEPELSLRPLHAGQARAYWALQGLADSSKGYIWELENKDPPRQAGSTSP